MNGILTKAGLGVALAATALVSAAPADAQYRRYWHRDRGGDAAAAALIGGVVGLGVGAAIASNNRDRYYDRGYYDRGGYYDYAPRYRAYPQPYYRSWGPPPPPPRAYYRDYYGPRGYYGGW